MFVAAVRRDRAASNVDIQRSPRRFTFRANTVGKTLASSVATGNIPAALIFEQSANYFIDAIEDRHNSIGQRHHMNAAALVYAGIIHTLASRSI